ncbi:MAG: DUF4388 domain-containing protein [Sandaracinaceae bacterium]
MAAGDEDRRALRATVPERNGGSSDQRRPTGSRGIAPAGEAVQELYSLAEARRTGEFVCSTETEEVHLHLQSGRVAWATSSSSSFRFSTHICSVCDVERSTYLDVLEECRRSRTPLGEVLVEWDLASPEQVRAALRRQVCEAVRSLRMQEDAAYVFLPRGSGYRAYDRSLTFGVRELLDDRDTAPSESPPKSVPPPSPDAWIKRALSQLQAADTGIEWIEHMDEGGRREVGSQPERSLPDALRKQLLGASVCSAVVRDDEGFVLGVRLVSSLGQVWCKAPRRVLLGAVVATLGHTLPVRSVSVRSVPVRPLRSAELDSRGHAAGEVCSEIPEPFFERLLARCPQLHALLLREGQQTSVLSKGRRRRADMVESVIRYDDVLERAPSSSAQWKSVSVHEDGARIYGASLDVSPDGETHRSIWLVFDEDAVPGLGWALLTSARRQQKA